MDTTQFNWRKFIKALAAIAIPVALQNLLTTTGTMVDTMMIAAIGDQTNVSAVGLCAQFTNLLVSCYWGFVGGGILFMSQYWGSKEERNIERSFGITLTCMLTVAAIFATLALGFPQVIMNLYTDKVNIQAVGVRYLRIVGWSYPLQVASIAISSLLRSTERVRIPLIASIASVATNLFLNWVFIFGNLGAPAMGVEGAALATVCAGVVNVSILFIISGARKYPYLFHVKNFFRWDRAFIGLFFKKCSMILLNEILIGVGNLVINIVLGHQVEDAIAAMAVLRTLEGLLIGFFAGFSNASSVLVGAGVGAGELRLAYERAKRVVYLCQICIFTVVMILFGIHNPLLHVMGLNEQSYWYGTMLLIIYGVVMIIRMGNWVQNDTFRSAGDAIYGTVLEIVFMYVLVLPAACIANCVFHAPFLLVFALCYSDEPIRFILMQIHMYSGKWIKPVTDEGKKKLESFRQELSLR